ncbi:MAG: hypothetical protein Q8J62_05820 [Candidatus Cloacimonadaceae bacterium]|nr:hypothetical protein [Candidatus Cloacimonadaceae bacterium]
MTALDISLVAQILDKLYSDQTIKLISPEDGIYVRNNRYNPVVGYNKKGDWRFDPVAANALLDLIEQGQYKSVRAIANAVGKSRQWVFVYMEAMASLEMIGLSNGAYTVLSREKIEYIGSTIIPGALGALRPKPSDEVKQNKEAEKEERRLQRIAKIEQAKQEAEEKERITKAWDKYTRSHLSWKMCFHEYLKRQNRK